MLLSLEIHNYAIIDHVEINFSSGLHIITGETGAGKSILLGALGLILGKRADTKVLYKEDQKCIVEARYDISQYDLESFFEENDLEYERMTTIRRVISPSGKSRAFINDLPTTLSVLKSLNTYLVDLHQQFDTLDIHQVSFQTQTLDALAENGDLINEYQSAFKRYQESKRTLSALQHRLSDATNEQDFIAFQAKELSDLDIQPMEYEETAEVLKALNNSEGIRNAVAAFTFVTDEKDGNIIDTLRERYSDFSKFDDVSEMAEITERLGTFIEELRDLASSVGDVLDKMDFDPAEIQRLTARSDEINRLFSKHGVTSSEELIVLQKDLSSKLGSFEVLEEDINELTSQIAAQEEKLWSQAEHISERRRAKISFFETSIHDMLVPLAMEHAYIKVNLNELSQLTPSGKEEVHFLFSANKGARFESLKDVASGGEVARLTLCIKALIAEAVTLPTMIFDEIDAGVSGEVAGRMGDIMHRLGERRQVIAITHSPQIAAMADKHFFVYKEDKEDRTVTGIRVLSREDRVIEIAKILSGDPPSEAAIETARGLLKS